MASRQFKGLCNSGKTDVTACLDVGFFFYGIPVNLIKRLKSPRNPTFKMGNRHLKPLLCLDSSGYCN